ncbi:tyrosine-protein phosphatase non-receptor type substrate 1 isoform X1 [Alligator mississippiensis]|uniref:Tyrosine-protein phosphatase non-receptor type substrate 1-like n=2 Tax=Alligator mississippiensis TaxID=8496 RepID=A0A151MDC3_ALLMI|nr:tyrosine-protein phosphatase non-receptor type substrate 1 isoform X1 [Alligator mississippiensis]KYO22518.1 tyrosine-protein phosphatase non-receptor type substrate 1-like [Alligator mississippiensis]
MMLFRKLQWSKGKAISPVLLICALFWSSGLHQDASTARRRNVVSLQGKMVKMECMHMSDATEGLILTLRRNGTPTELCSLRFRNFSIWDRVCKGSVTLEYDHHTKWVYAVIQRVSVNDSGIYNCTLESMIPPPVKTLTYTYICLTVSAPPVVELSLVSPFFNNCENTLTCCAWDFYPQDIQFSWYKDGELITSTSKNDSLFPNSNGSYSYISNLIISHSDWSRSVQFSCQVNHSALESPVVKHISLPRAEKDSSKLPIWILAAVLAGLLMILVVIILAMTLIFRSKTTSQSSADRVMPETAVMQLPQECQRENCHTTYVLLNYYPGSTL